MLFDGTLQGFSSAPDKQAFSFRVTPSEPWPTDVEPLFDRCFIEAMAKAAEPPVHPRISKTMPKRQT
jgi:carbamoylphosphate synthase small subunit